MRNSLLEKLKQELAPETLMMSRLPGENLKKCIYFFELFPFEYFAISLYPILQFLPSG